MMRPNLRTKQEKKRRTEEPEEDGVGREEEEVEVGSGEEGVEVVGEGSNCQAIIILSAGSQKVWRITRSIYTSINAWLHVRRADASKADIQYRG